MKCPKCGYNSFEFLDSCKKCGSDLCSFKESLGIREIVLSLRPASPAKAAPAVIHSPETAAATESIDEPFQEDIFGWHAPAEAAPKQESATTFPECDLGTTEKSKKSGGTSDLGDELFTATEKVSDGGGEGYGDFSFEETKSDAQSPQNATGSQPFMDDSFADLFESSVDATANQTAPAAFDDTEILGFAEPAQEEWPGTGTDFRPTAKIDEFEMEDFFIREGSPATANPTKSPTVEPQGLNKDAFDSLFSEAEEPPDKAQPK